MLDQAIGKKSAKENSANKHAGLIFANYQYN